MARRTHSTSRGRGCRPPRVFTATVGLSLAAHLMLIAQLRPCGAITLLSDDESSSDGTYILTQSPREAARAARAASSPRSAASSSPLPTVPQASRFADPHHFQRRRPPALDGGFGGGDDGGGCAGGAAGAGGCGCAGGPCSGRSGRLGGCVLLGGFSLRGGGRWRWFFAQRGIWGITGFCPKGGFLHGILPRSLLPDPASRCSLVQSNKNNRIQIVAPPPTWSS